MRLVDSIAITNIHGPKSVARISAAIRFRTRKSQVISPPKCKTPILRGHCGPPARSPDLGLHSGKFELSGVLKTEFVVHSVLQFRFAAEVASVVWIISIAISLLFGGKFTFGFDGQFICSGLVARSLERTNAIFDRSPSHIMPADLAKYFRVTPPPKGTDRGEPQRPGRTRQHQEKPQRTA